MAMAKSGAVGVNAGLCARTCRRLSEWPGKVCVKLSSVPTLQSSLGSALSYRLPREQQITDNVKNWINFGNEVT